MLMVHASWWPGMVGAKRIKMLSIVFLVLIGLC